MKSTDATKVQQLSEITESIDYGFTESAATERIGPRFLRITDIQNGAVDWKTVPFCRCDNGSRVRFGLRGGDIVFARTGATTGKSFLIRECPEPTVFASYLIRVRPGPAIDPSYLARFFETPTYWSQITQTSSGTAQPGVNASKLQRLKVPVLPLAEQKRIAAVLDKADSLRGKRRQALAKLDTLLQSVFLDMFGDPVRNSKGWPKVPLVQLCKNDDDIRCGPFGTQLLRDEFKHEGVPLWGIKHVNVGFSISTDEFVSPTKAKQLSMYSIEPGDIVMTRKGTIGNCAVYPENWENGIMHSDLLRLRVDRSRCHPAFLSHQLHYSPDVEVQLTRIAGGAIMQGVNVSRLKSLEVLAPPEPEQLRFLQATKNVNRFRAKQDAAMAGADTLFASLQSAAFAGTLFADPPSIDKAEFVGVMP